MSTPFFRIHHYRQELATLPARITVQQLMEAVPSIYQENVLKYIPQYEGNNNDQTSRVLDRYALHETLEDGNPALVLVIPSWNNAAWVERNLTSVFQQSYPWYRVVYIDDCSSDDTLARVHACVDAHHAEHRFHLLQQPERNGPAASRFVAYHHCDPDEVLCMLDGDDWLSDTHALGRVADAYRSGAMMTYGSYRRFEGGQVRPFLYGPGEIFDAKTLRSRDFRTHRWITQHLRTGYAGLFQRIRYTDLVDRQNRFFPMCTDLAETFPVLEMASPHIRLISEPMVIYNVDASNTHRTSYFRRKAEPEQARRRESITARIQSRRPYPSVSRRELFMARYLYPTWCKAVDWQKQESPPDYVIQDPSSSPIHSIEPTVVEPHLMEGCVRVLDACGLPALVATHRVENARRIWNSHIVVGTLSKDLYVADCLVVSGNIHAKMRDNPELHLQKGTLVVGWRVATQPRSVAPP